MKEGENIRILLVDDDEEDYLITKETISEIKNGQYSLNWVPTYEKALNEMQKEFYDLYLIDYNLGAKTGLDLIDEAGEKIKKVPVIILTGQNNREADILAMKKGVSDYLIKDKIDADILERSIRYSIEKKKTENQILYLAYYDQLTSLPNRLFFKEKLIYSLAHAIRYKKKVAVLFLDLDNFKLINDSMGHHIGDLLLKEVAIRVCSCVRKSDIIARNNMKSLIDTVARQGGDEFAIFLTEIENYESASLVANRIIKAINEPFKLENFELFTGASIGISMCPADSDDAETLIKYADNAMYYAKKQGKNNFQYYQKSMNEDVMAKIGMINNIRKASDQGELLLYYQPKMNIKSGSLTGFESLIRWNREGRELILPKDFIPFAEEHNLIGFITDWVINEVCRQLREWEEAGIKLLPVSINLPANQCKKPDFVDYIKKIVDSHKVSSSNLELEVTESIFMEDLKSINTKLKELCSLGFQVSIDDFGTGFSSLNRLKEVSCNILKIDKSFIQGIDKNSPDTIIIDSIISMGHGLGMEVLAEGVETALQYKFLKLNNCDGMQGYLLSPPLPKEKIPEILKMENENGGLGVQLIKKIDAGH